MSAPPNVYTAGYQGMTIDGFMDLLVRKGVEVLIDVRHTPMSRVFGFHASTLGRYCSDVGIEYRSENSLGVPKAVREAFQSTGDHNAFREAYSEIVRRNSASLKRVAEQMLASPTVVMCVEASADACHRQLLAGVLTNETGLDWIELRDG